MKKAYLIMMHDWCGEYSSPTSVVLSLHNAEELQEEYNLSAELDAKIDHPKDWHEYCDYYTIQEVPLYD